MHKLIKITLAAALPVVWAAGCSDFLKGGELTNNPNNATQGSATNDNLFIPIQVNQIAQQNSEVAWGIAQWLQSLYGHARQQVGTYNYLNAQLGTAGWDNDWNTIWTGGGLTDIRQLEVQALAQSVPDHKYNGIALIMEAWMIGNGADWWGALPYSQANNYFVYPTPAFDSQQVVYDSVLSKLDQGISELAIGGVGPGPGVDLVYNGSSAKWTALAHTLKARFMLHEVLAGGATYANVLTEANLGIASNAGDYNSYFVDGIQNSSNNWWQEMDGGGGTGRSGDIIAGIATSSPGGVAHDTAKIVKLLRAASDPRLLEYFDPANDNEAFLTKFRLSAGFPQPLVTYNENLLIKAEAQLHTGDAAGALTTLRAEQAAWAATGVPWHNALTITPASVANDSTIGTEKYFTLFQNVESWNDWKRLCFPKLLPVAANPTFGNTIPSRILYQITELQTNPNVPANGPFNWNDTRKGCTS